MTFVSVEVEMTIEKQLYIVSLVLEHLLVLSITNARASSASKPYGYCCLNTRSPLKR